MAAGQQGRCQCKDNDDETPLHLAVTNGHEDVAELLRRQGSSQNLGGIFLTRLENWACQIVEHHLKKVALRWLPVAIIRRDNRRVHAVVANKRGYVSSRVTDR